MILRTITAAAVMLVATQSFAAEFSGKKVLYIDSYHQGYAWSDGIEAGIRSVIDGSGAELRVHRMDTKRNGDETFKENAAKEAKALIEEWQPDVVIAADDNASKYLIVPYYKDAELPFVFAGVNWDASHYGFPTSNVTGMVEVDSMDENVEILRSMANGDRLAILAGDNLTNRKTTEYAQNVMGLKFDAYYVKTYDEWKQAFIEIQGKYDMMFYRSPSSVEGFDWDSAQQFVLENAEIPSGASQSEESVLATVTYSKVAGEQGEWAADAALQILSGTQPSAIPVARNQRGLLLLNAQIIERIEVEVAAELISSAERIIE